MTPDLIDALGALVVQLQAWLAGGGLVLARVGPVFALAPVLGERAIPVRIRLVAALAMTAVIAPAVVAAIPVPEAAPIPVARFLLQETLSGLVLGLALRLMVMALQLAGTMAAQATSLSQAFGGAGVDPQPAIAHLLVVGGLALAAMAGLPERLAALLVLSYDLFPPGHWLSPASLADWGTARVAQAFALGFSLAAPFVIGAGLYNLALGAINRAMPQLMVFFVGAPALTLGGLALLMLTAPLMFSLWVPALMAVLANPVAGP